MNLYFTMVIELSGVQFGLKSKSNERATRVRFEITSMISNQNCTTRSFNCHFIKSILKLHNFIALNFRFWFIVLVAGLFRKRLYISFSHNRHSETLTEFINCFEKKNTPPTIKFGNNSCKIRHTMDFCLPFS